MNSEARSASPTRGRGALHRSDSRHHHRPVDPPRHHDDDNGDGSARRGSKDYYSRRERDRSADSSARRRRPGASEGPSDPTSSRYRDQQPADLSTDKTRRRSRSRGRRGSPHSPKRHRSRTRSRSPSHRHRKKSKRHTSSSRRSRDYDDSRHHRRHRSPRSSHRRTSHVSPSRRRGADEAIADDYDINDSHRSPMDPDTRRFRRDSQYSTSDAAPRGQTSRSPAPSSRHESISRRPEPESRSRHAAGPPRHPSSAPRSPKAHRDQRRRRHHQGTPEHWSTTRSDVDDNAGPRSGYRGPSGAGGGYQPAYPPQRPSYHNDPRGYSQSPQPYRDSPGGQSPYGAGGRSWGSNFSPSHQPYPPSRPRSPHGAHRGSFRGRGFRTSSFSSGGRQRGPEGRWGGPEHEDPPRPSNGNNAQSSPEDVDMDRPPSDDDAEMTTSTPGRQQDQDGESQRQPPSGPSSQGKFSFAFKLSKPAAAAAPKPEISQKLNAAPPRKVSLDRSSGDRPPASAPTEPASARGGPPPRQDNNGHRRNHSGGSSNGPPPPPPQHQQPPRPPPEGPRIVPRTRKVTKTMRRPRPRPTLAPEHAASDSVFFRKPGNESVVGSGTYGKVFKGLNVYTKGLVALKRIRMEGERDGFPVTAVREIKLLQSLRHANIVNLQEVMVERNDCFMVFEYLSHDLTGLLNHPTFRLGPPQRKHLALQLMRGLDYLHARGVLHRDIKAANVLVGADGSLKLADFGLARFYAKHRALDYTNRVITIWYRAPELLLGETRYAAAVDVWSAACVLVEIFDRAAIFPGDGTELGQLDRIYAVLGTPSLRDWPGLVDMPWFELLKPTVRRDSTLARDYAPKISEQAFDLLETMFRYDPAKRPTAADVLQHPYFTTEDPAPQTADLTSIGGDWHEFESKALRKENEPREREAKKAAAGAKRALPADEGPAKRVHVEGGAGV